MLHANLVKQLCFSIAAMMSWKIVIVLASQTCQNQTVGLPRSDRRLATTRPWACQDVIVDLQRSDRRHIYVYMWIFITRHFIQGRNFSRPWSGFWCRRRQRRSRLHFTSLSTLSPPTSSPPSSAATGEPIWDPGVFTIIIIFFPHWWLSYNKLFYHSCMTPVNCTPPTCQNCDKGPQVHTVPCFDT